MSLDALRRNSNARGRGQGQGWARAWDRGIGGAFVGRRVRMLREGPLRVNRQPTFKIAKSFSRAKDILWSRDLFADSMAAAGLTRAENGTKLYISNLDYGVTNEDIKELFSEVGELKRSTTHYDRNGRPSGSAEVVYSRRSDAIAALKRYNNVQLDGKPMKIEIIGNNLGLTVAPRVNVVGSASGRGKRTVVMTPEYGQGVAGSLNQQPGGSRGRGRGRGQRVVAGFGRGRNVRGRGAQGIRGRSRGRGGKQVVVKTAEDLDEDLEKYHAEAMNTS